MIIDKIINKETTKVEVIQNKSDKYANIIDLISEVESRDQSYIDIDVLGLFEEAQSSLENITFTLGSMSNTMEFVTGKLNLRTNELNKINKIKDTRLRNTKAILSIGNLSSELVEFSSRIDIDVPIFAKNFKQIGKFYSKILLAFSGNESDDFINMKIQMGAFRNNVELALENSAVLLKAVSGFPVINSKFNQSKRQAELSIKNITKELLDGLMLLDEAIDD